MQRRNFTNDKVILFNGPPGSGKDLAAIIARNFLMGKTPEGSITPCRPTIMKFADPLKAAAHALLGLPYSCDFYEKEFGQAWKNEEQVEFYGKTPRSEYIALSEEYTKPRHGDAFFGRVAARRLALEKQANVFLFADSGFAAECVPLVSLVGTGSVSLIELSRPGSSFEGDSRSYVGAELATQFQGKIKQMRIANNGDKDELRLLVHGAMMKFLKVPYE